MAYPRASDTDIPGFFRYAERNPCRSFGAAAHCCAFWLSFGFLVLVIIMVIEKFLQHQAHIFFLHGKPVRPLVPWVSLSVALNVIITSMICFRLLRMRALIREVRPELSNMYTSIGTMLIESAAPFTIIGIGLVIVAAQNGPLIDVFCYVWSVFSVESQSFHAPFKRITKLCLPFPLVSLPANDHPPGRHGSWVAQRDGERVQLSSRIRATCHSSRAESGGVHDDLRYSGPHIWSRNAPQRVSHVNHKGHEHDRCRLSRLASLRLFMYQP